MGVKGLETFLQKHKSNKLYYKVNISEISHKYRAETGRDPVIVMDGLSCLRPLYGGLSWIDGGQFKEFYRNIQTFILNISRLDCQLVVFFEGPHQNVKLEEWKERRLANAKNISDIFSKLKDGSYAAKKDENITCLPNGLENLFLFALSEHKHCKVFQSIKECDEEVAQYAFDKKCFAILAHDSDYVIYRGAKYYLSIQDLDITKMATTCYDGFQLPIQLNLKQQHLPLFASLLGNDIVRLNTLQEFHAKLRKRPKSNKIYNVASYIRNLKQIDLHEIAKYVFGNVDKATILEKSISSYDLNKKPSDSVCRKENGCDRERNWLEVKSIAEDKHTKAICSTPLYDILVMGKYYSSNLLEDFESNNQIEAVGLLLKKLRQYIYGILLKEKPLNQGQEIHFVDELVMAGPESIDEYIKIQPTYLERVKHPGLKALWQSSDENITQTRWEILKEIFGISSEEIDIKSLPPEFVVPALAARYFKSQYPDMTDTDLNALIACNVCVRDFDAQGLAEIIRQNKSYRQIWMYTAITRIHTSIIHLLFFIGEPVEYKYVLPHHYTDGKLFHEKYRQSHEGKPLHQLCGEREENVNMFNQIKNVVLG